MPGPGIAAEKNNNWAVTSRSKGHLRKYDSSVLGSNDMDVHPRYYESTSVSEDRDVS